jgi:hypothetical protein
LKKKRRKKKKCERRRWGGGVYFSILVVENAKLKFVCRRCGCIHALDENLYSELDSSLGGDVFIVIILQ